jgi:dTDP-4-amino-4,6-dideoxygalactose transaminase
MSQSPIFVTQPSLPPLAEFIPYLEEIWANRVLTNDGPFHKRLEHELVEHLGVAQISLFNNGTVALQVALQALCLTGEVITTPFSFVATTHAILWSGLTPVFVDIEPETLNIDPAKIEAAITPRTTAILAVHCYGTPCNIDAIADIARRRGLRVIYDAAHAFGVTYRGESILRAGDLSVLSFHATKVFNTFEGGAVVSQDVEMKIHIDRMKNFGIVDPTTVVATGTNGKISEVQAAFGLLQLRHLGPALERRIAIDAAYREAIEGIPGIRCLTPLPDQVSNGSYFPVLIDQTHPYTRDEVFARLASAGINGRRYFYPLISAFPMYAKLPSAGAHLLPVATRIAEQVLCLPIYADLPLSTVERVARILRP